MYKAAQANAAINGRDYVIPEDIKSLAADILKHRIIIRSETKLKNVRPENIIEKILTNIAVPIQV